MAGLYIAVKGWKAWPLLAMFKEPVTMVTHDPPILADHNVVSIGVNFDRPANGTHRHREFIIVEAHQAGLRDGGQDRVDRISVTVSSK